MRGRIGLAGLIIITSLVAFVPFAPEMPSNSLDSGWAFGVNTAAARGLVFGRDIIFTFGPYASVFSTQYHPATDAGMVWASGIVALAFAAILIALTQNAGRVAALGLAVFVLLIPRDAAFFAFPLVSLLLVCRVALPPANPARIAPTIPVLASLGLLVLTLSLLPLVKATFAIAAFLVMGLGCALLLLRGLRRLAIAGGVLFAVAMPVFWLSAGQTLGWLPDFFLAQLPLISGYGAAMSTPDRLWQGLLFGSGCIMFAAVSAQSLARWGSTGAALFAGAAALVFLAFKEAFVRDDGHAMIAGAMLGLIGFTMVLGQRGRLPLAGLAAGLAGWVIIDHSMLGLPAAVLKRANPTQIVEILVADIVSPYERAAHGLATRLRHPSAMAQKFAASLAAIRAEEPLPSLTGTTDIYSYGQAALLAQGLDWAPRPLLQSYAAYTPELAWRNALHLQGADAPENVLFTVQPIDNRLPALEDGASWPDLLNLYQITGVQGDVAVLKRRPASPVMAMSCSTNMFRLDEPVPLPADMPVVWAQIGLRPAPLGAALALLFRLPQLRVTYSIPGGADQSFRYVAGMGAAGFVAAPLVLTTADFAALAGPNAATFFAHRQPASFTISTGHGAGWLWRDAFSVRFCAMRRN